MKRTEQKKRRTRGKKEVNHLTVLNVIIIT